MSYKNIIGDGKLPNKYWVSLSNDYYYYYIHKDKLIGMVLDWIGDLIPSFKSKGKTIVKPFKTHSAAKGFCEGLILGADNGFNFIVNRINIEDRLSGVLYERTKIFDMSDCSEAETGYENTRFSVKKMAEHGIEFI